MNNELVNELAKLTHKFKRYEYVECIYFIPTASVIDSSYNISFNIVIKSNVINDDLKNAIFNYNISSYKKEFEKNTNIKININIDESCYYNNMLDNSNTLLQKNAANDLFNSTILYDKSGKYSRIKKQIELNNSKYDYPWIFKYENCNNQDLALYNVYKLKLKRL